MRCSKPPTWPRNVAGSKVWLVSLGPKAKLQQVMMTVAQKAPFELVPLDGPAGAFTDPVARERRAGCRHRSHLRSGPPAAAGLRRLGIGLARRRRHHADGGRAAGHRRSVSGRGCADRRATDGSFEILERIEGGRHQVSVCAGPPALVGWATGNLPEPRNNPQVGMANMRTIMPALQKARAASLAGLPAAIPFRHAARAAARDARGEGPLHRRDRARNRRLD